MAGEPKPCVMREKCVRGLWMLASRICWGRVLHNGERSWFSKSMSSLVIILQLKVGWAEHNFLSAVQKEKKLNRIMPFLPLFWLLSFEHIIGKYVCFCFTASLKVKGKCRHSLFSLCNGKHPIKMEKTIAQKRDPHWGGAVVRIWNGNSPLLSIIHHDFTGSN